MQKINNSAVGAFSKEGQMKYVAGELQGLRAVIEWLWAGEQEAFNILYFCKTSYKEWPQMFVWMKRNNKRGKSLIELFQNESPDGGGYHMGAMYILSRINGHKREVVNVKVDQLL